MNVSRPDIKRRFLLLLSVCLMAGSAPLYAWQDTDDDSDVPETEESSAAPAIVETQTPAEPKKPKSKLKKVPGSKNLYFLGARPDLKRQQGPAIGNPANILPQPFVPRGSIQIPPAPSIELVADLTTDQPIDLSVVEKNLAANDTGIAGEDPAIDINSAIDTGDPIQDGEQLVDDPATLSLQKDSLLEAGVLERLDPSGVAVGGVDASYTSSLWQGYDRSGVVKRLAEFTETSGSPSLVRIANRIALSGTVFEDQATDAEVLAFVDARLSLLMQLGNRRGYADLLAALPAGYDWTALSRHFANAYLLDGKIGDACSLAAEQRESDEDAYWLRMVAFCDAARGNRIGVDFQLRILEEVSDVHPTFYQLIDQILVEAEQPPGGVLPASVTLPASLQIDVLEATMARLARAEVPQLAQEGVNPLATGLMLSLPGVTDEAKTELMGLAVRRGWANGDLLAAFARALKSDSEKETAAVDLLGEDNRFEIDAILVHLAALPAERAERVAAVERAWARALKNTYSGVAGESLVALSGDFMPGATGGGVMARAALVSGDVELAARWFTALRSQAAGTSDDLDAALISVAPLMTIAAAEGVPTLTDDLLERWWQAQDTRADRFERANLLFTVIEALGGTIGDEAWGWLENGPVVFGGAVPAPAQWRRFLISARNGDTPKALAFAFRLLSDGGPAGVSASLAGSLVGTLNDMGLVTEAHMIATEILISQGL